MYGAVSTAQLPADLTEMKGESGSQRKHVIAQTVWIAISVEILECSCVREFQHSTNPFGNTVLC